MTPMNVNLLVSIVKNNTFQINQTVIDHIGTDVNLLDGSLFSKIPSFAVSTRCKHLATSLLPLSLITTEQLSAICGIGKNSCAAIANTPTITDSSIATQSFKGKGFSNNVLEHAKSQISFKGVRSDQNLVWSMNYGSSKIEQNNALVATLFNSLNINDNFVRISDTMTGDITCVTSNPLLFGQDLIAQGKVLDLEYITDFGKPSTLLRILNKNNALSLPLSIVLNTLGIHSREIKEIVSNRYLQVSVEYEKIIFKALSIVKTRDELNQSLVPLNCQLKGITSLVDLLNVKKLFPSSWKTLFFPNYDIPSRYPLIRQPIPIFVNGNFNHEITRLDSSLGHWLNGIYDDLTMRYQCGAFVHSMLQIKDIEFMDVESFAQVVSNMETISDLQTVNTVLPSQVNPIRVSASDINYVLNQFVKGSGKNGTQQMIDLFGAASGIKYDWNGLQTKLILLDSPQISNTLSILYNKLVDIQTTLLPDPTIDTYIENCNQAIISVCNKHRLLVNSINDLWESLNLKLETEIKVRNKVFSDIVSIDDVSASIYDVANFVNYDLDSYSRDCASSIGMASILEALCRKSEVGGQALIASMRESRNRARLKTLGTDLDNNVSSSFPSYSLDSSSYTPKTITVGKQKIVKLTGDVSIDQYNASQVGSSVIEIDDTFDGSLSSSSRTRQVKNDLDRFEMAPTISQDVTTAEDSVDSVVKCSCDF